MQFNLCLFQLFLLLSLRLCVCISVSSQYPNTTQWIWRKFLDSLDKKQTLSNKSEWSKKIIWKARAHVNTTHTDRRTLRNFHKLLCKKYVYFLTKLRIHVNMLINQPFFQRRINFFFICLSWHKKYKVMNWTG